ncbi:unnamed protein product [Mytilus edulis]|uniref:C2H2-type domain-containing protein n=1 Tax=Mytilus edulis TaxID=6550 RepID=A0A8S3UTC2_MYTED|nr:unnamed protein product [Mytilus edulis]
MAADGTTACDSLLKTIEDLSDHGVVKDKIMELKSGIKSLKLYLKSEYSRNIDMASTIPDHCMKFALSSSSDVLLQEKCDHQHEALCEKCGLMEEMEHQIKTAISSVQDFETASDIKLSVDFDISKVKQWKSHILRTKNQNECRYHLMETLESHQMIIVMDWAMKFLPLLFREKQSDFYGQKGLNWHVSVAIFRSSDGALKHNTFTHLLNGCKQDWYAVASILEHTLHTIKAQKPEVEEVFLRSDNAGCYHCGCLWLALDGIGERTGIRILRYDYSEPQAGKSVCDSKIAHMRCKMKMHVSSGGNITTAEDMQAAIMSGSGVSGCQCAVVSVDTTKQTMFQHKLKGVNSISNLKFEENNIIYWQSFNIGIGRKIMRSDVLRQEQEETGLIIHSNFDKLPDNKHGDIRSCRPTTVNDGDQENRNEDADVTQELPNENVVEDIVEGPAKLFLCPEQGCIKMYQTHSNLERHVYLDRHVYESNPQTSTYDQVRKKWAETCCTNLEVSQVGVSTLRRSTEGESVENDMTMMTADQNVGWALKKDRKVTRFSTRVKSYLSDVFQAGNISGKKVNSSDISKLMKCSRNEDGERRFCREECLTTSQINSYFSRLALLNRRDGVHNRQRIELMEDEDLQSVVAAIEDEELRETLHAHLG